MTYHSVLWKQGRMKESFEDISMPKFFYDLNLDQVVNDIMEEQKLYDLKEYYYELPSHEDIEFRQSILKDLEQNIIYDAIENFSLRIRKVKEYIENSKATDIKIQEQKWLLDGCYGYVMGIDQLRKDFEQANITSDGMKAFLDWLSSYCNQPSYMSLKEDTYRLMNLFHQIKFHMEFKRDRIIIQHDYLEEDYCKELLDTFHENHGLDHVYLKNPFGTPALSYLESNILQVLKKQYPDEFQNLDSFYNEHKDFLCETILTFEREIQFYISFLRYKRVMEEMGFFFSHPKLGTEEFQITQGYDLALARSNASKKKPVICNDCYYLKGEQFLVVTGPNQGGKTTFARSLGQIVYFSHMGLMVPAEQAMIPYYEGIFTHFAMEENISTGAGKLKEELIRVREMMDVDAKNSFVIINEIFTSATSYDAYIMGNKVLQFFMDKGCMGAYVTHIYELTKDPRVVSMVAALKNAESSVRTFRIERKPSDGKSYANSIVEKYRMTYSEIKERIKDESKLIV